MVTGTSAQSSGHPASIIPRRRRQRPVRIATSSQRQASALQSSCYSCRMTYTFMKNQCRLLAAHTLVLLSDATASRRFGRSRKEKYNASCTATCNLDYSFCSSCSTSPTPKNPVNTCTSKRLQKGNPEALWTAWVIPVHDSHIDNNMTLLEFRYVQHSNQGSVHLEEKTYLLQSHTSSCSLKFTAI